MTTQHLKNYKVIFEKKSTYNNRYEKSYYEVNKCNIVSLLLDDLNEEEYISREDIIIISISEIARA